MWPESEIEMGTEVLEEKSFSRKNLRDPGFKKINIWVY